MRQDYYDGILAAVRQSVADTPGGRTHHITARMGWKNGSTLARRYLLLLEREGLVRRHALLSFTNSIWWEPV